MNIFQHADKISEAYANLSRDEKAEFSENMKTASQCGSIIFVASIALVIFKLIKK